MEHCLKMRNLEETLYINLLARCISQSNIHFHVMWLSLNNMNTKKKWIEIISTLKIKEHPVLRGLLKIELFYKSCSNFLSFCFTLLSRFIALNHRGNKLSFLFLKKTWIRNIVRIHVYRCRYFFRKFPWILMTLLEIRDNDKYVFVFVLLRKYRSILFRLSNCQFVVTQFWSLFLSDIICRKRLYLSRLRLIDLSFWDTLFRHLSHAADLLWRVLTILFASLHLMLMCQHHANNQLKCILKIAFLTLALVTLNLKSLYHPTII